MKKMNKLLALVFLGMCSLPVVYAQESNDGKTEAIENNVAVVALITSGEKAFQDGNIRLGSFYFANAITKEPGNMQVVTAYHNALMNAFQTTEDIETKFAYLSALEVFLQNQAVHVPVENVATVMTWLDEIEQKRSALESSDTTEEATVEETTEENAEELALTFSELQNLLTSQSLIVAETLKLVETDARQSDIASYQLQDCEQTMRNIISLQPQMNDEQKAKVAVLYANLQTLSQSVVDMKAKKEWDMYLISHTEYLKEMEKLGPYSKDPTPAVNEEGKPAYGPAERRLQLTRTQMEKLQSVLPKLSDKYLGVGVSKTNMNTATKILQQMQTTIQKTTEVQQKNYNLWALNKIKICLDKAHEEEGYVTNGQKGRSAIGNILILHLASIDIRLLTHEVSRAYLEVEGKYLSENQLNRAVDKDSFKEPGNIMYTIERMYQTPKVPLSRF